MRMKCPRCPQSVGLALSVLCLLGSLGCVGSARVVSENVPKPPAGNTSDTSGASFAAEVRLRSELAALFEAPRFDHTLWGVVVRSLNSGQSLYRLNATKLVMPASNMKAVTLAATAEQLGWDYRYETQLLTRAAIEGGVLLGDLIVHSNGDPTFNRLHTDPSEVFTAWANELKRLDIRTIEGRIIGDDNAFDESDLGAGWAWDYLGYGYAAPIGTLQLYQNTVSLEIRPGDMVGDPIVVEVWPAYSGLELTVLARTVVADAPFTINLSRLPGQSSLKVSGSVPVGAQAVTQTASVPNPTEFFVRSFRAALNDNGIVVRGDAIDIDELADADHVGTPRQLLVHRSPPLTETGSVLMKVSQNLYAETFLKTLGGQTARGNTVAGREVVRAVLTSWGISPDAYVQYDGSGLSRYNYVTADMLVAILTRMHRDPKHTERFKATLPMAGRDGSLAQRLKGSRAENNARAKTGSISKVRGLSGYVTTLDGELLAFSIIANHFHLPQSAIDAVTDLAVERLANFTRQ